MLDDAKRTIAFFCPNCRQAVIVSRSAFQLAAAKSEIKCPCGESSIHTELLGDRMKLEVPCLFCEQEHSFTCSTHAFLHEKTMAFSCGPSGLDCCYTGEEGPVYEAMNRLQETLDGLEEEAAKEGMFLNPIVMQEILEELRDIGQRDGVSCTCGSKNFSMKINFSAVELECNQCKGSLKVPATTQTDIDDLCCKPMLTIRGHEH